MIRLLCTIFVATTFFVAGYVALAEEQDLRERLERAVGQVHAGELAKAVDLLRAVPLDDASLPELFYWRGRTRLLIGEIKEAVADLDRYVELRPKAESRQWERGLAYYYAGKFAAGAKQFELYQTYHDQDVENSVWRFLCLATEEGVDRARATLLPIERDRRVPMMQVFAMFQGKTKPAEVLAAAEAPADEETSRLQQFYAHFYVGLYLEALGEQAPAAEHLRLAATKYYVADYMGDLAKLHVAQREAHAQQPATK